MIKYFSVKNFSSIKEESILAFDSNLENNSSYPAHPVIGFMGANASGKTTILNAITFTLWFMQTSFFAIKEDEDIPIEPFCTTKDEPTSFDIIFVTNSGAEYEYELSVTTQKVIAEKLYKFDTQINEFVLVYQREDKAITINFPMQQIQSNDLRNNASIISYAAQFESQSIAKEAKNYKFFSNVRYSGYQDIKYTPRILAKFLEDEETYLRAKELLKIADIGIEDFETKEKEAEEVSEILEKILQDKELAKNFSPNELKKIAKAQKENNLSIIEKAVFKHKIDSQLVDFGDEKESLGTLRFMVVMYLILRSLKEGSLLIFDEIEMQLQQDIVAHLISLYQNPFENPNKAQLLFTSHNSSLLTVLLPEQFWMSEKNDEGHTSLFSAADFEDIEDIHKKDMEKLYRFGRLGAKPRLL